MVTCFCIYQLISAGTCATPLHAGIFQLCFDPRNNAPGLSSLLSWLSASPERISLKMIHSGWASKDPTAGLHQEPKHNLTTQTNASFPRRRQRDVSFLDFSVRLKAGIHRLCCPLRQSSVALFVFNSSLVLVHTVGQLYPSNSPFG